MKATLLGILSAVLLITCADSQDQQQNSDHALITTEVEEIIGAFNRHLDNLEFEQIVRLHTESAELTVIKDGVFYKDGHEYYRNWLKRVKDRFTSIDSASAGESHVYVLSPTAAVYQGSFREIIGIKDDDTVEVNGAYTAVLRKIDGSWKIIGEHISHAR
jgi:ketosteroid isomerase-like protein